MQVCEMTSKVYEWCIISRLRQFLLVWECDVKTVETVRFVTVIVVIISDGNIRHHHGIIKGSSKDLLVPGLCSRALSSAFVRASD